MKGEDDSTGRGSRESGKQVSQTATDRARKDLKADEVVRQFTKQGLIKSQFTLVRFLACLVLITGMVPEPIYSSQVIEAWVACRDGPSGLEDRLYSLAVNRDGNVYAAGRTRSQDPTGAVFCVGLVKHNPDSTELESRGQDPFKNAHLQVFTKRCLR